MQPESCAVYKSMAYFGKGKYVLRHWKRLVWRSIFNVLYWAFMLITIIGTLLAFLPEKASKWFEEVLHFVWSNPWPMVVAAVILFVIALFVNWPRTFASYKDKHTDIRVILECCDILEQEGTKVIHVVDTFDMELGRIISPKSLHGAFLKYCQQAGVNVDEQVDNALAFVEPVAINEDLPGRKSQYELGTVCRVEVKDETFCCVAFTRLKPNGTIQITKEEYVKFLMSMWRNLTDPRNRADVINVAVMGNKFVDLPAEFSTEQKIDLMVQTFFAVSREKTCCRTLRICVHPDNAPDIEFSKYPTIIEHLAKRPVI